MQAQQVVPHLRCIEIIAFKVIAHHVQIIHRPQQRACVEGRNLFIPIDGFGHHVVR
ncbi:hypothetical protein SPHINGOT1_610026 [Sphingomonas sp. T1]|nr:hypothetical protein SPHINGOT1_610026 [Sphingomonas sp. T1]